MNAVVDAATLAVATASAECTPVTELFNTNASAATQDQIFFGVQSLGKLGLSRKRHVCMRELFSLRSSVISRQLPPIRARKRF